MIRPYQPDDLERLKEITAICFEHVSIDRNIEKSFGEIGGHDWRWRKLRHIDDDVAGENAKGVLVFESENGTIAGYITTRIDNATKIGRIPNLAVMPENQGEGIGKQLMEAAFAYLNEAGMEYAKIETLDQNPIGSKFYPSVGFQEVARQIHYLKPL